MCCLRISNRYSRMWFSCVQNVYISFFQMRDACERWRNDLGGQSQGDVASPLKRYIKCLHISVEVLLGVSRFGECTYSSSDNEILSLHCRRVLSSKNCRCYVVFVTMSTKYDDLVEKWWRQTDKHVIVTSSRTFSHITHTSLLITETHYNKLRISFNFRVFFQKIDTSIIMLHNVIIWWYFGWGNRHALCVQHSMTIVRIWIIMSPPTQSCFASTSPKK